MNIFNKDKAIHSLGTAKTKNGVYFYPDDDTWKITDVNLKILIYFKQFPLMKDSLFELKKVFKWYLENYSPSHSYNMYKYLKVLLNFLFKHTNKPIKAITDIDLINYRAYLGKTQEWQLGSLSGFLKKWHEMGYSLVSKSAHDYLNETVIKGNRKGEHVLTMDPLKGPYSDLEFESIQMAINNAYTKGNILVQHYLIVWFFIIYGLRPIQLAQLKIKDIIPITKKDIICEIMISIPRVKNRKKVRSEFKKRVFPTSLTPILYTYYKKIKITYKGLVSNIEDMPLFPDTKEKNNSGGLAYHMKSNKTTNIIKKIFNDLNLMSERTGDKLLITPRRFRYTLGTRAASEGHGELIIAEILDHTDTQNAGVYVQATPEIIKRIDKAIAMQMAPLAQSFAGILIKDKSKAIRASEPEADIIDPAIDSSCRPAGKCGSYGFCNLMSPLACYTCNRFQAWTDGPHEMILMRLLKERERLLKVADYRIASINDRTILAVAQVVLACREFNQKIEVL